MKSYAPGTLRDALEVALEVKLGDKKLAEFYRGKARPESETVNRSSGPGWSGDHWTPGLLHSERELQRDLDALQHIPADCPRDHWRKVVAGIADRHLGSELGREIARAWSLGGDVVGVTFLRPSGDYSDDDFETCWRDACRNPHFSIGTVFHLAKAAGWNSSRARWGLDRVQRSGKPMSAEALQVQQAGLAMPRRNPNLERIAWYWRVLKATPRPDLHRVAFVIAFSINIGSGFAFRPFESIANLLDWSRGPKGEGFRRVSRSVRDLALLGFIVRSPGNERGAHGRIGPSFALTLPDAMTWEEAVSAYQADFGAPLRRSHDQPEMVATGTAQGRSKPKGAVQTGTRSGGSKPNGSGVDRHQEPPVQTTPSVDRHQDMPVHLTVNDAAGGGEGKRPQARAQPAALATPQDAAPVPIDLCHDLPLPDGAPVDAETTTAANGWTGETFWGPAQWQMGATHD